MELFVEIETAIPVKALYMNCWSRVSLEQIVIHVDVSQAYWLVFFLKRKEIQLFVDVQ